MMYDDDALDRALAALPLEEPPADLHARIMAATAAAPAPASALVPVWELWLVVILTTLALWLAWIVAATPHVADRLTATVERLVDSGDLTSASTIMWVAAGVSAAWWIAQISFPRAERIEIR